MPEHCAVLYIKTVRGSEEGEKYYYVNYEYADSLTSGVCYICLFKE